MSVNSEWNRGATPVKEPGWFRSHVWDNYRLLEVLVDVIVYGGLAAVVLTILATPVAICYAVGGKESAIAFLYVTGGMLTLIFGFWTLTWLLTELSVLLGFNRDFVSKPRGGCWWWN